MGLILSHGQSSVKRGFSINSHIMAENLKEKWLCRKKKSLMRLPPDDDCLKQQITRANFLAYIQRHPELHPVSLHTRNWANLMYRYHTVNVWSRLTGAILDFSPKETPDHKIVARNGFWPWNQSQLMYFVMLHDTLMKT